MDAAGELLVECAPGLWEGCSPHQRAFDGKVLPKILCCAASGLPDALHILAHNKAFIEEQLLAHGAVLLRGFPLQGAADFDTVVRQAFGWQEVPYVGKAIRKQGLLQKSFSSVISSLHMVERPRLCLAIKLKRRYVRNFLIL